VKTVRSELHTRLGGSFKKSIIMEKKRFYGRYWALLKELQKITAFDSKEVVAVWTDGRTESLKDLSDEEYTKLCEHLEDQLPEKQATDAKVKRQRAKIISIATQELGWCLGGNASDVDWTRFNRWMKSKSYLKKQLNAYKPNELPKLVSQFESMAKQKQTQK